MRGSCPALLLAVLGLAACSNRSDPDSPWAQAWVDVPDSRRLGLLRNAPVTFMEGREGTSYRVLARSETLDGLARAGLPVRVEREDHRLLPAETAGYHDPDDMVEALADLAEAHPDRVKRVDLGSSVQGRPLVGVRIGSGPRRVRLAGAHHGNEPVSGEVAFRAAEALVEADLPGVEIWVVPHVNPDGIAEGSRYNARSVDLNRNYDYQWWSLEVGSGSGPFSEPESRAVRTLALYGGFATGLSFHAWAQNFCYVWNWTFEDNPDEDLLRSWGEAWQSACALSPFDVVDGAGWYVTHGDTTDWSYGRLGTLDTTLEVSESGAPDAAGLEEVWSAHAGPILDYVGRSPSLVGYVTDAGDGAPVEARIVPGDGWPSFTGPDGAWARYLPAGPVEVVVEAPGYLPAVVSFDVFDGTSEEVAIALEPGARVALRPEPALLSWSDEPVPLSLPGVEDEAVTLSRPGLPDVVLSRSGDSYPVVPSTLEPGPWTLLTSMGAAPRSLFVGERDDRCRLDAVTWTEDQLRVDGQGFGLGSRAWVLGGPTRPWSPVPVVEETGTSLVLDVSGTASLEDPLDLVVVTAGAQLTALDIRGAGQLDTGAPLETGWQKPEHEDTASTPPEVGGTCACGGAPVPAGLLLPILIALPRRRRRIPPRPVGPGSLDA